MILPGATLGLLGGGQLGRMFTARARTMALDPKTHNLYLASAQFEAAAPAAAGVPRTRPKVVPGSFHVAVFSLKAPS